MHGAADSAAIATSITIATSLLTGLLSSWVSMRAALRSRHGGADKRDTAVTILFGIAVLLILLFAIASARIAVLGMAYVGLFKAALLLTAAFAVAGMVFGLVRGRRSGTAIKPQRA
jgi:hypothetical protein